jgi:protein-L-isoaspartate(D-aspartate) O-methyltransferase
VGLGRVQVVVGDGYLGEPTGAPYDRIVVTTGSPDVAPAWEQQLVDGGRLVVPIVDPKSGAGVVRVFDQSPGGLDAIADLPCGFLPLRRPPAS